jgi:TetR/AcrR family transcriptional regulator, transcriptional repressor for nem operon
MVGVRQFDEQEVIALALDVFWRKGLHDATMQDLAAATGVQRGSLYNAYGDKEAIFLRAFDQYAEQFLETAAQALAEGDAAERLRTFFDVIIVNMTSGSPSRGCLTTRTALDAAISSEDVRARVQGLLSRLEQIVSAAIGSVPNANRLARVIVTFTRGLAVMERAGYSRKQLKESAATFVDALVSR